MVNMPSLTTGLVWRLILIAIIILIAAVVMAPIILNILGKIAGLLGVLA